MTPPPKVTRDTNVSEHWATLTTDGKPWSGGPTRAEAITAHLRGVANFRRAIEQCPEIADEMPEVAGPLPITGLRRTVTKTVYLTEVYPDEAYNGEQPS